LYGTALTFVLLLSAFVIVRGYRFGAADQNEYLPQLYRMLDPGYLGNDWFTNETAGLNPRTYFIAVLAGPTAVMGAAAAHLLLYAACFAAFGLGVVRLGRRLFGPVEAAVLGLAFVLFGPLATLGSQDLLDNYLQQSMLAATGVTWALVLLLERRWWPAWLLAGLVAVVHVTTGMIGAVLLGVVTLLHVREIAPRSLILSAAAFLVPALAANVPLWLALRAHGGGVSDAEFIAILGHIRAPWHYIPSQFGLAVWAHFGLLVVAGAAALRLQPPSPHRRELRALVGAIAVLCAVAYVFVELVPVATVLSLNLVRSTVFLRLLAMLALGGAVARGLEDRRPAHALAACAVALGIVTDAGLPVAVLMALLWLAATRWPAVRPALAAVSAIVCGAAVVVALVVILAPRAGAAVAEAVAGSYVRLGIGALLAAVALGLYVLWIHGGSVRQSRMRRLGVVLWLVPAVLVALKTVDAPLEKRFPGIHDLSVARLQPAGTSATDLDEMAAWCRTNTPADAVFIIPPDSVEHDVQRFRVRAGRAIVADFKAIAFTRQGLHEWRKRLRDLTNDAVFAPGADRSKECADGYTSLTPGDFRRLAETYDAAYILVEKPHTLPFQLAHETAAFRLYKAP
jgi:hypothetical protein